MLDCSKNMYPFGNNPFDYEAMITLINVVTLETVKPNSYVLTDFMYLHSSGGCYLLKYLPLLHDKMCFRSSSNFLLQLSNLSTTDLSSFTFFLNKKKNKPTNPFLQLEPALFLYPFYHDRNNSPNSSVWTLDWGRLPLSPETNLTGFNTRTETSLQELVLIALFG